MPPLPGKWQFINKILSTVYVGKNARNRGHPNTQICTKSTFSQRKQERKNIRFNLHPFKSHFLTQNISAFHDTAIVLNEILGGHRGLMPTSPKAGGKLYRHQFLK